MRIRNKSFFISLAIILAALSFTAFPATAQQNGKDCSRVSVGFTPLSELGEGLYRGMQGGLYPEGKNTPPMAHSAAGLMAVSQIQPLNASGSADPVNGSIVLISIGMSNTTQEFSRFVQLVQQARQQNENINPRLVIVDGAQGGKTALAWSNPRDTAWTVLSQRLTAARVTPSQVQVAWIKLANAQPTQAFPEDASILQRDTTAVIQLLKQQFPNLRITYVSNRIYAGYALGRLNPEPYAYQSSFAVKWLIEDQINGSKALNYDPMKGDVRAPWLAWGPYLWADGMKPRSDGLIWECSDFNDDGTHPSNDGRAKVANLLLQFFKTDPTASPWFLGAR